jgi:hypothetical protein
MFPNTDGGFIEATNYRNRVLPPLADSLGIPKLNFQVVRRTFTTRTQSLVTFAPSHTYAPHYDSPAAGPAASFWPTIRPSDFLRESHRRSTWPREEACRYSKPGVLIEHLPCSINPPRPVFARTLNAQKR